MKILIVASGNSGNISPFVSEQVCALNDLGIDTDYFLIEGLGIIGYLKNIPKLRKSIKKVKPDIIHAHYGLSGLVANLLLIKTPVITTFHGSDINIKKIRIFSKIAFLLSTRSFFVSKELALKLKVKNPIIIPCGIDINTFKPIEKKLARKQLNINKDEVFALFSSSFSNPVKNSQLAKKSIDLLPNVSLKELSGYNRNEVALLINASDLVLLTSFTEGSPQIIKEALSCNTPVVSTDVGDVKEAYSEINGCFITSYNPKDIAEKILLASNIERIDSRTKIIELGLDNKTIAERIIKIYLDCLKK